MSKVSRHIVFLAALLLTSILHAQIRMGGKMPGRGQGQVPRNINNRPVADTSSMNKKEKEKVKVYPLNKYKYFFLQSPEDTITIDTLISPSNIYKANYVQKDLFGFMPFQNMGQPVNRLSFELLLPENFYQLIIPSKIPFYKDHRLVPFYHAPTPYSRLFYLSGNKQGQMLDSKIGINVLPNFYIGTGYSGLSSLGYYRHSVSSQENWFLQTEYFTPNKRYLTRFVLVKNHLENEENGGITDEIFFTNPGNDYLDRGKIPVKLNDKSIWHSRETFWFHQFRLFKQKPWYLIYRFEFLKSYFQYEGGNTTVYGNTVPYSISTDSTGYKNYKHLWGVTYRKTDWEAGFKVDFHKLLIRHDTIVNLVSQIIPRNIQENYTFLQFYTDFQRTGKEKHSLFMVFEPASKQKFLTYKFSLQGKLPVKTSISYQEKQPDPIFRIHQSRYKKFNWKNDFSNSKKWEIKAGIHFNQAGMINAGLINFSNWVYFGQDTIPKQFSGNIQEFYIKYQSTLKWRRFGLAPTIMWQKLSKNNPAIDFPEWIARFLIYYEDDWFKKHMHLLTGIKIKSFTPYYMAGFNPLTGTFFQQRTKKYGGFYLMDLFFDFKVKKFRAYVHWEHFNALWERFHPNYFSAPDYPYADTFIRLGIEWEFTN